MFLGLDLGTTNIKALAVEADGRVVAEGAGGAVGRDCTPDGGVVQDLDEIWRATCQAIRQAVGTLGPRRSSDLSKPSAFRARAARYRCSVPARSRAGR